MPRIELAMLPWQVAFRECQDERRIVIGGVGSGKSIACADWLIEDRIEPYPRGNHYIIGATYPSMKIGTIPTFEARLDEHGIAFKRNNSDLSISIRSGPAQGSVIRAWTAEKWQRLKGQMIDSAWLDEAQIWKNGTNLASEAYDFVVNRMRPSEGAQKHHGRARKFPDGHELPPLSPKLVMSANPPHWTAHWLYQYFVVEKKARLWHVTLNDNWLLPQRSDYIARLRETLSPEVYKIEVKGEWGDVGIGRAYTSFYRTRCTNPDPGLPSLRRDHFGDLIPSREGKARITIDHDRPLIWSHDFGVMPRAATVMQLHRLPRHFPGYQTELIYVLDAIEIPDGSTDTMIKEFERRYPPVYRNGLGNIAKRKVYVYGDPSGHTRNSTTGEADWDYMRSSKILQRYDIEYIYDDAAPPVWQRVMAVNAKLCNADDSIGILFDPGDGSKINAAAAPALEDFQGTRWKEGTRMLDKGSPGRGIYRTHLSDSVGYFVDKAFPVLLPSIGVREVGAGVGAR